MRLLFFILLIFFSKSEDSINLVIKNNQLVNKAELAIVEGDLSTAFKHYSELKNTFGINNLFAKDIWNFANIALEIKDTLTANVCLNRLLELDYEFIGNKCDYVSSWISKSSIKPKPSHPNLTLLLDSLIEIDQKFRRLDSAYILHKDTIQFIDNHNADILNQLFTNFGYPTENMIGCKAMFNLEILLVHQNFGNERKYDFTDVVNEALRTRKIETNDGAYLVMRLSGKDVYGYDKVLVKLSFTKRNNQIHDNITKFKDDPYLFGYYETPIEMKKAIFKQRNGVGLCNLKELREKSLFHFNNKNLPYKISHETNYSFSDKKQYELFQKGFIVIRKGNQLN